jgi:hypothetical protein
MGITLSIDGVRANLMRLSLLDRIGRRMTKGADFSFAAYADDSDRHIGGSIRGYDNLREDCVALSQYFIQKDSVVLDIGCSSGE